MLGSAFMYALHVVLSQRVMFEMPAQTMTLYTLTFIGATVLVVRLAVGTFTPIAWTPSVAVGWWYLFGLMAVTALSRLTLFAGVRGLEVSEAKRLRDLERENKKLKQLVADLTLDKHLLQEMIRKKL